MRKAVKGKPKFPVRLVLSAVLLLLQLAFLAMVVYDFTAESAWAYIFTMILGTATVIGIINRRGDPDHKIAWIIFILLFPIFGITVFFLWGGGRVLPHIKKKMTKSENRYMAFLERDPDILYRLKYYDLLHSRQADFLEGESGYPLYTNTSTEYVSPGEKFFSRLLEELEKAEKYIYIEYFIIAEGEMWDKIHKIIKRKVKDGVEVKIIFDDFGSVRRQRKGFVAGLKAEGIEVSAFNPISPVMSIFMNNRNHRKIIIIDGKTAMTGGINIGDEYINHEKPHGYWMDCALIIKGTAVKSFLVMFCSMWEFVTKKSIDISSHISDCREDSEGFVLPYSDGPLSEKNPAEGIYLQILNTAQKYVYLTTPYLIIDNTMKSALKMAAKSGVDIKIITPHIPDKWYVHPVTQYNYLELLESGVKIYEYSPGFIHSKLFVSDDKIATVGTINMDYRSFVFHFECGVWLCDTDTVTDIKVDINSIISESEEITLEKWRKRPPIKRIIQSILHLFAPFM